MQFKTFQGKTHTVRTATSLDNPQQSVFAELFKRANANNPQMKADILRAIVRDIMWTQNGAVPSPSEVDAKIASVAPITFKQGSGKEVIAQTDSVSTTIELPKRFGAGVALKLAAPFIFAAEAIPLALSGIGAYLLISYAEPAAAYACMAATEPFVAYGTLKGMKYTVQKLFTSKKEKIASDIICEVEKAMNNPVVGAGADLQYELPLPNSNNRGTTGAAASESTQNEAVPPGLSTNLFGDSTGSAPAAMAPGLEQKIRAEAARMSIDPDLAVKVYVHALEQNGLISFQDSASSLNVSSKEVSDAYFAILPLLPASATNTTQGGKPLFSFRDTLPADLLLAVKQFEAERKMQIPDPTIQDYVKFMEASRNNGTAIEAFHPQSMARDFTDLKIYLMATNSKDGINPELAVQVYWEISKNLLVGVDGVFASFNNLILKPDFDKAYQFLLANCFVLSAETIRLESKIRAKTIVVNLNPDVAVKMHSLMASTKDIKTLDLKKVAKDLGISFDEAVSTYLLLKENFFEQAAPVQEPVVSVAGEIAAELNTEQTSFERIKGKCVALAGDNAMPKYFTLDSLKNFLDISPKEYSEFASEMRSLPVDQRIKLPPYLTNNESAIYERAREASLTPLIAVYVSRGLESGKDSGAIENALKSMTNKSNFDISPYIDLLGANESADLAWHVETPS